MQMDNRILPNNLDSEKIVIGSILSDVNAFSEVGIILKPEMFYDKFHRELYEYIVELESNGKAPDIVILSEKYKDNHDLLMRVVDISGF